MHFYKHTDLESTWHIKSGFWLSSKYLSKMLQFSWKMSIFIKIHIWTWKSRFFCFPCNNGHIWVVCSKVHHSKTCQTGTCVYINKTWTFRMQQHSTSNFISIIKSIILSEPMKIDVASKVQVFAFCKHLMSNMACLLYKESLKAFSNQNLSSYQQNLDF